MASRAIARLRVLGMVRDLRSNATAATSKVESRPSRIQESVVPIG
jgi:hypothetical protein